MLGRVHQQYAAALASAKQHLRSAGEAWEIGSRTHDIESSLERFQIKHDDSVRSFYAYISAPSSSDLLREHGFVGFDASGEQAVRTESIDALACQGFAAIKRAGENCKDRLGLLRREEPEDLDGSNDPDGEWASKEIAFDGRFSEHVASRINMVCRQRIEKFVSHVSERIDRFVLEAQEEQLHFARLRGQIWKARGALAGRSGVVVVLLSIVLFAFSKGAPDQFSFLWSILWNRLFEAVLVGVLTTLVVLALVYVVSGAKNATLGQALRPVFLARWVSHQKRGDLSVALKAQFDESYDKLVSDLGEMPLRSDHAIADGMIDWLKNESESFLKAEHVLAEIRQLITSRCQVLDDFIGVVDQNLEGIPKDLRDTAGEIKKHAIEEHMSRIRSAADFVENVRSDVEYAANIAGRPH